MGISRSVIADKLPKRIRKHRKIRRLVEHGTGTEITKRNKILLSKHALYTIVIFIVIGVTISYYLEQFNIDSSVNNFMMTYQKHYHEIAYGQTDYCNPKIDTYKLFALIQQQQILNQNEALQKLETTFRNNSHFTSIAVVGPVGVGKSLWARSLLQHFPWRENVYTYAWNTYVYKEQDHMDMLLSIEKKLSQCGRNLIIIENVPPVAVDLVTVFNKRIKHNKSMENKYINVVYIFNLNTMLPEVIYQRDYELLQDLPNTITINFKRFGREELKDCIRREAAIENITLRSIDFDEIVKTINVSNSGCKKVYAKVMSFANTSYTEKKIVNEEDCARTMSCEN